MSKKIINMLVMAVIVMTGIVGTVGMVSADSVAYDHSETIINMNFDNSVGIRSVEQFYINYTTHEKVPLGIARKGNTVFTTDDVNFEFSNNASTPLTISVVDLSSNQEKFKNNLLPGYGTSTKLLAGRYVVFVLESPTLKSQELDIGKSTYLVRYISNASPRVTSVGKIPNTTVVKTPNPVNYTKPTNITHTVPIITATPVSIKPIVTTVQTNQPCGKAVCVDVNRNKLMDSAMQIAVDFAEIGVTIWNAFRIQ